MNNNLFELIQVYQAQSRRYPHGIAIEHSFQAPFHPKTLHTYIIVIFLVSLGFLPRVLTTSHSTSAVRREQFHRDILKVGVALGLTTFGCFLSTSFKHQMVPRELGHCVSSYSKSWIVTDFVNFCFGCQTRLFPTAVI